MQLTWLLSPISYHHYYFIAIVRLQARYLWILSILTLQKNMKKKPLNSQLYTVTVIQLIIIMVGENCTFKTEVSLRLHVFCQLKTLHQYFHCKNTWNTSGAKYFYYLKKVLKQHISYFESCSFPLTFIWFWFLCIKRVVQEGLGLGVKLHRPVPHSKKSERAALCLEAFTTLPKQTGHN